MRACVCVGEREWERMRERKRKKSGLINQNMISTSHIIDICVMLAVIYDTRLMLEKKRPHLAKRDHVIFAVLVLAGLV